MSSSFSKAASRSQRPLPAGQPALGSLVGGKYRLVRALGCGGMGSVYKAENVAIGKVVALKLLHHELAQDEIAMQRFRREARATVSIAHPNIVEVLDMGQGANGAPFLVMEYVRGANLKRLLRAEAPLPLARAASIAGQILGALSAAHKRGVIHRDLKPENILVSTRQGRELVKVVDFGISTFVEAVAEHERELDLTPTGLTMATPFYASPEQIRGAKGRDPRVDLYAVGVLLYEMLTGHRPFESDNFADLCTLILAGEFAPLGAFRCDLPPACEALVRRALANEVHERFQSARELELALVPFGAPQPRADAPDPSETCRSDLYPPVGDPEAGLGRAPRAGRRTSEPTSAARGAVHDQLAHALLGYFERRFGAAAVRRALAALDVRSRRALAATAIDGAVLARALSELDRAFGRGDRAQISAAGRYFAKRELAGEGAHSTTPELFFLLSAELWQRYLSLGRARVSSVGRGYGRLEIQGAARPPIALMIAMLGVLEQGLRGAGGHGVTVRVAESTALGDEFDAFEASWTG